MFLWRLTIVHHTDGDSDARMALMFIYMHFVEIPPPWLTKYSSSSVKENANLCIDIFHIYIYITIFIEGLPICYSGFKVEKTKTKSWKSLKQLKTSNSVSMKTPIFFRIWSRILLFIMLTNKRLSLVILQIRFHPIRKFGKKSSYWKKVIYHHDFELRTSVFGVVFFCDAPLLFYEFLSVNGLLSQGWVRFIPFSLGILLPVLCYLQKYVMRILQLYNYHCKALDLWS